MKRKKLWQKIGIAAFWLSWPALFVYLHRSNRTRVLVVCDNKVLVTKGWLSDGKWTLPGGGVHRYEDPLKGALRELYEETGLRLSKSALQFCSKQPYSLHGFTYQIHYFVAKLDKPKPVRARMPEIAEVAWLAPEELTPANANKDVRFAVQSWADLS